jgi:hypothetical protein
MPILEVLKINVDIDDVKVNQNVGNGPECRISCTVGEHKSYNQFTIQKDLPQATFFRLWLV